MTDFNGERIPFESIQYRTVFNTGQVWSKNTRLYFAELRAYSLSQQCVLYDHTRFPQNPIVELAARPFRASDPFPPKDVKLVIERGVYVSYSNVMATGGLTIGFNP